MARRRPSRTQGKSDGAARARSSRSPRSGGSGIGSTVEATAPHALPELPFPKDSLRPHVSAETLEFHHGKHHRTYVDRLNELVRGTEHERESLGSLVRRSSSAVFDQAAQHFNHSFYWMGLMPNGGREPTGGLAKALRTAFGSFAAFREQFEQKATAIFGTGWCWLVVGPDGRLSVEAMEDAGCPLRSGRSPLYVCDVWEHAYYLDYRHERAKYVRALWNLVNWEFVEERWRSASKAEGASEG